MKHKKSKFFTIKSILEKLINKIKSMSATLAVNTRIVKPFGHKVDVPNDPIAKLMYYLDCVNVVVQIDNIITSKLIDYQNYFILSRDEKNLVYKAAKLLDPSKLINVGVFNFKEGVVFSNGLDNQFLEITEGTIGVHVNQEIEIGGILVKVNKTMDFNERWLKRLLFRTNEPIIYKSEWIYLYIFYKFS